MRTLELIEHRPTLLARDRLSITDAEGLASGYGRYLDIAYPSVLTSNSWVLSSKGWVGAFIASPDLQVFVKPKIPIRNLGRMIAAVYDLQIDSFPGLVDCLTLQELYDHLVRMLAQLTARLARQGLHHEYRRDLVDSAAVRGRIDIPRLMRQSVVHSVPCHVAERTPDLIENRAIAYSLDRALRSGICSDRVQSEARAAFRMVSSAVTLAPVTASECVAIQYTRLTDRYRSAHAVCRLLLESAGPVAAVGNAASIPFLLNMPQLFEAFVANWIGKFLGTSYVVASQLRRTLGERSGVDFFIDIVIRDANGHSICVLDTKYKDSTLPSADDLAQVGYYALLEGCHAAGLIVPTASGGMWEGRAGNVSSFRSNFDLSGEIEESGAAFGADLRRRLEQVEAERNRVRLGTV